MGNNGSSGGTGKGIGLFGLTGMVVSSCIGSGVFALTGQIAQVASPGGALVAWLVVGVGFLALAFSLNNLAVKRPDADGIFAYAQEGFGPFAGFLSGWGYWLSAWLGNVAFATMLMSTLGYFLPVFAAGNTLPCIVVSSVIMWLLTLLVIRGVESASFLNAIVMIAKVASIGIFIGFAAFLFNAQVLTADFWGTLRDNAVAMLDDATGADVALLGGVGQQVVNCLIIMMWSFIGIEGASVMAKRATHRADVGRATVIGLACLLVVYAGASVLPYGVLPYTEIAAMGKPAMLYVFEAMAPGWGGAFISVAIMVSVLGAWLSFIILPAETTSQMAQAGLVPARWGKLTARNSPRFSLLVVAGCTQAFLLVTMLSEDAYDFAFSLCTVAIVVTWALAAAYQLRYSARLRQRGQAAIGAVALAFQVAAVLLNGWTFLLLTCVGYLPGFIVYAQARKEQGGAVQASEMLAMFVIALGAIAAFALMGLGIVVI